MSPATNYSALIMHTFSRLVAAALVVVTLASCTTTNRLAEYEFAGKTLFVVDPTLAQPDVHLSLDAEVADSTSFLEDLINIGEAVASQASAQSARDKLEDAYTRVDQRTLLVDPLSSRLSRYLGADIASDEDSADYVIFLEIKRQGVAVSKGVLKSSLVMVMDGDIRLVDNLDGREIWRRKIKERKTVSSEISGLLGNMLILNTLSDLSEEQLADHLEQMIRQLTQSVARDLSDDLG